MKLFPKQKFPNFCTCRFIQTMQKWCPPRLQFNEFQLTGDQQKKVCLLYLQEYFTYTAYWNIFWNHDISAILWDNFNLPISQRNILQDYMGIIYKNYNNHHLHRPTTTCHTCAIQCYPLILSVLGPKSKKGKQQAEIASGDSKR